ncbi:alpha-L-arabinofuranosidase, partial [bacterium]|nr:alpha-L-arabinofuranosidase [bacterium]
GRIETGRWYDLKVEVKGKRVKCTMDGQVVHDIDFDAESTVTSLYATAAVEKQTDEIILKIVNANSGALATDISLTGARNLAGAGTAWVLTSDNPTDENSLAEPMKVSPKSEPVAFQGSRITRVFPGNSFTVMRLKTR